MAKLIYGPVAAECVSAEPASPAKALDWASWRKDYEGKEGWLRIYKSEKKSPGRLFAYFHGGEESERDWWLKTNYGEWCFEGENIVFRTRNSRYKFRVSKDERIRWFGEKLIINRADCGQNGIGRDK